MKQGRISRERQKRRKQWIKDHPPNHQGAWVCFWCQQWVYEKGNDPMELGHKVAKGGLSISKADSDENLGPIHTSCNREQGSTPYKKPKIKRKRLDVW
jgi:hypothetical protein